MGMGAWPWCIHVGVGTLQPLACAIFPEVPPWAGKTGNEHWEKLHTYKSRAVTVLLLDWKLCR